MRAITQHPLLPLRRAVRHRGRTGKCESLAMPCNAAESSLRPARLHRCAHSSRRCFHVTLGVDGALVASAPSGAEIFIHGPETHYETSAYFYGSRSRSLVCHILPAYINARTRSDRTACLSSSDCIMLFFVNVHNTHYHKTHYVGGKLSHPACALTVCDV